MIFKKRNLKYKIYFVLFNLINNLCNRLFLKLIEYE